MGKTEIWELIRSIYPNDEWIDRLQELNFGYYRGGDENYWYYNDADQAPDMDEGELWDIYQQMKHDMR